MGEIVFFDSEINHSGVKPEGGRLHTTSHAGFSEFVSGCRFGCGHNVIFFRV